MEAIMESSFLLGFLVTVLSIAVLSTNGEDFISWGDLGIDRIRTSGENGLDGGGSGRVIVVSMDGNGDSRTVQGAVDMVADGNKERVRILISPGVYRERVVVPRSKPYVSFIGNGSSETVISWHLKASDRDSNGKEIGTLYSASVAVEADYFCANGIVFENTATGATAGSIGMQAAALRLSGDKAVMYRCRILGLQDTLYDHVGRHYFSECYIRGSIDFVLGGAKSLYQGCTLHSVATGYGAVAASQRELPTDDSGFSFVNCRLVGSGTLYLGRAWGKYARVVYAFCQLDLFIDPEGWSDWGDRSRRRTAWFGEYNCNGRGANQSLRARWARSLSYDEAKPFLDRNYIDGDKWLRL